MECQVGNFKRRITIRPQGDQVEIRWYLIGDKGAVDFHIHSCSDRSGKAMHSTGNMYGGGVESHSPKPIYEGQTPIEKCDVINGHCYADGTSLFAMETVMPDFMKNGEDAVWRHLEQVYADWFKENTHVE